MGESHTNNVLVMSNLNVFISSDYGWIPKKKSKARKKLFGEDDFKFFIFMSIFIFCLAGLVLIIVGLHLRPGPSRYQHFAGPDYESISIFITVLGFCILPASFLGIYGVFNDIIGVIYFYFFFLFCVIVAQAVAGFSIVTTRPTLGAMINSTMMLGIDQYLQEGGGFVAAWDQVQQSRQCCGINNYTHWGSDVPRSCYRNNDVYTRGCFDIVRDDVIDDIFTIFGSCASFVVLEMFAIAVIVS